MKRKALIRHLEKYECILLREGANHSVYINSIRPELKAPVPRHKEIEDFLAIKICKELDIPTPN
ncbi:MAG: addiction module toxin, HicA family [Deltaproteobacteria bacterium]|nr:addiction module toxin, HicA family [Deltaproteobacteria bacterium]